MNYHDKVTQLLATIEGFGRPSPGLSPASIAAAKAWDLSYPEKARARWAALEELDRLETLDAQANTHRKGVERELARLGGEVPLRAWQDSEAPEGTGPVLAAREWWAMRPTPCLVLAGGVGTGKTVASLVVLRAAAAAGLSARYLRASTAARMGAFGPESAAAMRDWCTVGVLAIDDLGSELANQAWQAALTELLDTRLSDGLATVVTTNATPAALLERYGERVTDRLRQSGTAIGTGTGSLRRPAF